MKEERALEIEREKKDRRKRGAHRTEIHDAGKRKIESKICFISSQDLFLDLDNVQTILIVAK